MSVERAGVIDFISNNVADECCVLTISDHLEWGSWEHLLVRQEKLNNYLAFMESGEVYEVRPHARDQELGILFSCKCPPESEDDFRFLQLARDAIEGAGFRFFVVVGDEVLEIARRVT